MKYYVVAVITFVSAALGLLFSIGALRIGQGREKENALYMFARSVALVFIAVIPLCVEASGLLAVITGAMLIVQIIDGIMGIYIKSRMRTMGPFIMATFQIACLCTYM